MGCCEVEEECEKEEEEEMDEACEVDRLPLPTTFLSTRISFSFSAVPSFFKLPFLHSALLALSHATCLSHS